MPPSRPPPTARAARSIAWLGVFVLLAAGLPAAAGTGIQDREVQNGGAREYGVKAAFIYNFAKFVEWPTECFGSADSPFVIGVLGSPQLHQELEKAVHGRKVNGRIVRVQAYHAIGEMAMPQILFVGAGAEMSRDLLARVADRPILTVGESEDFLSEGGVIGFVFEADKLRFVIDMNAAGRAQLKISAQLQKLARPMRSRN